MMEQLGEPIHRMLFHAVQAHWAERFDTHFEGSQTAEFVSLIRSSRKSVYSPGKPVIKN